MKFDDGKVKLTLVPRKILYAIARIREYGVKKYKDPDNWKSVEKERYRDAAFRHFLLYLDDPEGVDEESGLPHLWHLACNVSFLCEMEEFKKDSKEKPKGQQRIRSDYDNKEYKRLVNYMNKIIEEDKWK